MLRSREVKIGNIIIGGSYPVVIQSMTNTNTNDVSASVDQCIRLFNEGATMVRLTTQGLKEVENLNEIKKELVKRGYLNPVIADVHYSPHVAKAAAKVADKIRINPGNFAGFQTGRTLLHTPTEYTKELTTIREYLGPIVEICRNHKTAIRIGVNHGSLSDRILGRYGDTPAGMAESAMEFIRILHNMQFHDIVVSMKSSNARVMVYATRMLVKKMQEEEKVYPVHLGLTEAGEGEDGRIKSTIGIATLLGDGIGDTIRVSLTEDPESEIPVANKIKEIFADRDKDLPTYDRTVNYWSAFEYSKRVSLPTENIGGRHVPVVIMSLNGPGNKGSFLKDTGYQQAEDGRVSPGPMAADFLCINNCEDFDHTGASIYFIIKYEKWKERKYGRRHLFPILDLKNYAGIEPGISGLHFLRVAADESDTQLLDILDTDIFGVIDLELPEKDPLRNGRQFFNQLARRNCRMPVILHKKFRSDNIDELIIRAAGEFGPFLLDGLGDGIWIEEEKLDLEPSRIREIAFNILQSSGMRIFKTEYISCPGCGRTLYDIQSVSKTIREATSHLAGLKIAIMGCMVNGPGEMADADYGYIGAGPGKVSLYRGREAVKKGLPEENALEELIALIKEDGKWSEVTGKVKSGQ